jgi:hypothetical protein
MAVAMPTGQKTDFFGHNYAFLSKYCLKRAENGRFLVFPVEMTKSARKNNPLKWNLNPLAIYPN